ncbi:Fungalysin/Thermolysin Extracellular metalloproteinase 5 [Phlyctochytrium bullatum]|nr:Fungalysin/Thermolysin Extracellular metalloproteinase 5 [Phlyctochytrium bullatum]
MLPIIALAALASVAAAIPAPAAVPVSLPKYHVPKKVFNAVNRPSFGATEPTSAALSYLAGETSLDQSELLITSAITSDSTGLTHVHAVQTYQGLPIVNLRSNVNVKKDGTIVSAGLVEDSTAGLVAPSSFGRPLTAIEAVVAAAKALGYSTTGLASKLTFANGVVTGAPFALLDIHASEKYYYTADGTLEKIWDLDIYHREDAWNNIFLSQSSGAILGATNFVKDFGGGPSTTTRTTTVKPTSTSTTTKSTSTVVSSTTSKSTTTTLSSSTVISSSTATSKSTSTVVTSTVASSTKTTTTSSATPTATAGVEYYVVPFTKNSILEGGQSNVGNPQNLVASPNGWLGAATSAGEFQTTGNNVKALQANKLGTSQNGGKFNYVYDTTKDPASSIPAAVSQVFYLTNTYHDILYQYGFTEATGNFQTNNFGKGGRGSDAITANIQSSSGTNNANFATPADGSPGVMNMYVFTLSTPKRDGDMDNGVVTHELTHGLSNRLTGGTGAANCLETDEAGGMGEGWSDVVAFWATMDATMTRATDRVTGAYVVNKVNGIRTYPYSTSTTTNKNFYSVLKSETEVHRTGEVWATILYEVYWNVFEAAGNVFEPNLHNSSSQAGNIRFLQLVVDGLKIQPCNPTFIQARDAIIQADATANGGKFKCAIWKAFAKRGLGTAATSSYADSFQIPTGC